MFEPRTFSNLFGVLALATCSMLVTAPAWGAVDFPRGVYSGKSLTVAFDSKGQFHVDSGKVLEVQGVYAVNGDEIRLTDKSGPEACAKGQETGAYHWKYAKGVLAFTKVADACAARSGDLTKSEWKKK